MGHYPSIDLRSKGHLPLCIISPETSVMIMIHLIFSQQDPGGGMSLSHSDIIQQGNLNYIIFSKLELHILQLMW